MSAPCSRENVEAKEVFLESKMNMCLLHFSNDFLAFKEAELQGIAETCNLRLDLVDDHSTDCPFKKYKTLTTEDVQLLCLRSVSLRSIYDYWCEASTMEELLDQLSARPMSEMEKGKSFRICIEPFNRTYANRFKEKLLRIDLVADALKMTGPVRLKDPDVVYTLFEYYGPHGSQPTIEPSKFFFGTLISESRREQDIRKFSIKTRKFIGNTSMDPTLSLLMANIAGVKSNSLVLDPFVGTGSLLLACAHYGSYVVGTDINKVLLHGRGRSSRAKKTWREQGENVRANFEQYSLASRYLDVLVADASKHSLWAIDGLFDAIITDPPYGIREQTLKLEPQAPDARKPHFMPPTSRYNLSEVFTDLLTLSGRCLRVGGKLVFWLPIHRPDYHEDNIPTHPCFKLISNCEQILSTHISRRLITLQKILEPFQLKDCDLKVVVSRDHYNESFRDRYFHLSSGTKKLNIDSDSAGETS